MSRACPWLLLLVATCPAAWAYDQRANQEFSQQASWDVPAAEAIRELALAWLAEFEAPPEARARGEALWASAGEEDNRPHALDLVSATLAAVDPRAAVLVEFCARPRQGVKLPDVAWLADEKTAPFERANLRLYYGRWLAQEALYDEAAEQLAELEPAAVVDPASLLFYQAVVQHRLLDRTKGLATIGRLLERADALPKRYTSLARLMQADLEGLKDESLDHISRRMDDIRRRLDLGRAGPKVREVEDGVIASLDKLIEEMEKQQQAAAAAAAARSSGQQPQLPTRPLPDSMPMGGKGAGQVAKKPIGNSSGWGDLPPRERDEALQQIGKEFPAHYRDMIEQFFRKLATEGGENSDK
jgi:hypothetical protein